MGSPIDSHIYTSCSVYRFMVMKDSFLKGFYHEDSVNETLGSKGSCTRLTTGLCVDTLIEDLHAHRAMDINHTLITGGAHKGIFLLNMILRTDEFRSAF